MKIGKALLALFAVVFAISSALAQDEWKERLPNEAFGLGIQVSPTVSATPSYGGVISYALSPEIQFGTELGFYYVGSSANEESKTFLIFSPYVKYFLEPVKMLFPFAKLAFKFESLPIEQARVGLEKARYKTESYTAISIATGAQWFPYKSVGVYGGFEVIKYDFDRSRVYCG